jgi:FixJ family two-component response regulator
MKKAKIYVIDDDSSVRTALGRLLRSMGYDVRLLESAGEFMQQMETAERGCILLDVQMPGLTGPQLQEQLIKTGCDLPIIFLTGHGDLPTSVRAIKGGAEDFLAKPARKEVLAEAIERALKRYDEAYERNARNKLHREHLMQLTPRESQVLNLVVRGKMNKQIAYELGASERTIKAHRHSIVEKLKVRSVAELVSIAEHTGILAGKLNMRSDGKREEDIAPKC